MYDLVELQVPETSYPIEMQNLNSLVWIGTLVILAIIVGIEVLRIALKYNVARRQNRKLNQRRAWQKFYNRVSGRSIAVLVVAVCVSLCIRMLWPETGTVDGQGKSAQMLEVPDEEEVLASYAEQLKLLRQEQYVHLTLRDKLAELQRVANISLELLGCEPVQVVAEEIDKEGVMGYYSDERKQIVLDTDVVEGKAEKAISVVLHECAHAYQFACVASVDWKNADTDLKLYREVYLWKLEMENYINFEGEYTPEEYLAYASQAMEQHADAYSATWTMRFMKYIEQY